ncbi:MAG: metallophosphoesterase [Candidatus Saccharibacteria bacterium]
MLGFAQRKAKAALTGLHNILAKLLANTKGLKADMRLFALLIAIVATMVLVAPMDFQVREGRLTYQLALGSRDGGYVQFSLGPVGSLNYHTHAVPINLKMNLVLRNNLTNDQSLTNTFNSGIKRFKLDAVNAFYFFLATRILLIAVIGLSVGVIRSNGGKHWFRQTLKNALRWATCLLALAGVLVAISYCTLDRTPEAKYTGLAQEFPKVLNLAKRISGNFTLKKNMLQDFVEGFVTVPNQIDNPTLGTQDYSRIRILVASDIHDNFAGMKIASEIVNDKLNPYGKISALVLAGDITVFGQQYEASLFEKSLNIGDVPIYFVGGNHEDTPSVIAFQQMGYKLLDGQVVSVGNIEITGESDPTALTSGLVPTVEELKVQSELIAESWSAYTNPPDVLIVHNIAQAQGVINVAKSTNQNLTVVYGHDHAIGHKTEDLINLIDCGTGGASGFDEIGRNPNSSYTFQILEFSTGSLPVLTGVTTLGFNGLNGSSSVTYDPIN